jgi:uncharacterized protein (DUF427 family)
LEHAAGRTPRVGAPGPAGCLPTREYDPPVAGFAMPATQVLPTQRWIRVRVGDTWIADSRRARVLVRYGPEGMPTYLLPPEDVRADVLDGTDVVVGDLRVRDGAERREDGSITFRWGDGIRWYEEAMEVVVHARDPTKRVDAIPSERHLEVHVAGERVVDTRRPHGVFETGLPVRWYVPMEDVREDLLEPSGTTTMCPYKGTARYWHVRAGGELHEDLAWSYPDPVPEIPRIRDLVCFFDERVDVVLDGVAQERPVTPWSA